MTKDRTLKRRERRRQKQIEKITPCEPICVECGGMGILKKGSDVWPHRSDLAAKDVYVCVCGARVGCHPHTTIPLGRPAGEATRSARSRAHAKFDPLWTIKAKAANIPLGQARELAYKWLGETLGIPPEECHIGMMDRETALRVAQACDPANWRKAG